MVLTYFGTVAQIEHGLVAAQKHYFDSVWCWLELHYLGLPFSIPFPGALSLLTLLTANLIAGGIVRLRWRKRNAGVVIAHFGILLLIGAGLVKFVASTNGFVRLGPGEQTAQYTSFNEWEVVVGELRGDGTVREHLIPQEHFRAKGEHRSDDLPFRLVLDRYAPHCRPRRAKTAEGSDVVEGFYLEALPPEKQASANIPGLVVEVIPDGEAPQRGILWGMQTGVWTVRVKGVPWQIDLRRRVFDLPYGIRLDRFTKEEHPGVDMPRHFSSDVTTLRSGNEQKFHIAMNEPMRSEGFMFSQNNWGPQDGSAGPYWSVLEVSSNPADQWPKYACFVIAFGLLIHFLTRLFGHVERQRRTRLTTGA